MIKLYLSVPYSNEIMKRFWWSKLNEENTEALLRIKVEGPKID